MLDKLRTKCLPRRINVHIEHVKHSEPDSFLTEEGKWSEKVKDIKKRDLGSTEVPVCSIQEKHTLWEQMEPKARTAGPFPWIHGMMGVKRKDLFKQKKAIIKYDSHNGL